MDSSPKTACGADDPFTIVFEDADGVIGLESMLRECLGRAKG
jgi:hypothetical protein